MKFRVRNLWKKAYQEGRLNDIPAEVKEQVLKALGEKKEAKPVINEQFTKEDFEAIEAE